MSRITRFRFTFFSSVSDNCCKLILFRSTCSCRICWNMFSFDNNLQNNTVESANEIASNDEITSACLDNRVYSSVNFRRAISADNIHGSNTLLPNSSWCPIYWNWPQNYVSPQQYWNLNYSLNPNNFTPQYYTQTENQVHEGFINSTYNNQFVYGRTPSFSLLDITSTSRMYRQTRSYMRRNRSADHIPQNMNVHPKVLKVLSKRYWEDVNSKEKLRSGVEFTLMSYNVLAQDLITEHPYLYKLHNPNALQWEKRWKNLLEEIKKFKPDILCLQEVQASHLSEYYNKLESLGYKGIYKKRTGIRCDGCAIYYQTNKFKLVEYETVEYYQPNVDVLNRDNVAIIAKFSPDGHCNAEFIVATTHLLYNPNRQDVRLAQTQLLIAEVERLSFCRQSSDGCYLPIIITGDFNSTPNSAVYEFITKGVLKYNHLSARSLDKAKANSHGNILVPSCLAITDQSQHAVLVHKRTNNEPISRTDEAALIKLHHSDKTVSKITSEVVANPELFCSGTISHLFALKSVYDHGEGDNVEGTTFQDRWISVDFIFYSGKKNGKGIEDHKIKLLSRYRLPRKNELGSIRIPNTALGSDHLCLLAKFRLKI